MPLNFPNNPSVGQTYQSGSSAVYQFNNRGFWNVVTPSPQTFVIAPTASYVNPLRQNVFITGSLTVGPNNASGFRTVSIGAGTTASGDYSHAEGIGTWASAEGSHAEGYTTTASAAWSHAEGDQTTAASFASHAEGSQTIVTGYGSHVEGLYTIASGDYQHVEGRYNTALTGALWIVGNGTADENRSNLIAAYEDNLQVTGSVSVTGSLNVFTNLTSRSEFEVASTGVRIGNHSADSHTITGSVNVSGSITAPVVIIPTVAVQGNPNQAINNSSTIYSTSTRLNLTAAMTTGLNQGGFTVSSTGITPTVSGFYEIRIDAFGLDAGGTPTLLTSFIGANSVGLSQRLHNSLTSGYVTIANSCVANVTAGQLIDFRFGTTGGELITIQGASVFVRKIA
jgi:hypothetical protein